MKELNNLKEKLKPGRVYRRSDLTRWTNAVDRHLQFLLQDGTLVKLSQGLYYTPKPTAFGFAPPDDHSVVKAFLKSDDFLILSPNMYNSLNLGTTQLYNLKVVYNRKRQGDFEFGGKCFSFRKRNNFPKKITEEFLLADLMQNIQYLAEEHDVIYRKITSKIKSSDKKKLLKASSKYGNSRVKKKIEDIIKTNEEDLFT